MFQITKTMKKALFVSALAAAVLAACQSPEVVTSPDVRTFGMKGNWTERTILSTTKEWDLEDEDSEVEISETRYRERRIITYWSDKN